VEIEYVLDLLEISNFNRMKTQKGYFPLIFPKLNSYIWSDFSPQIRSFPTMNKRTDLCNPICCVKFPAFFPKSFDKGLVFDTEAKSSEDRVYVKDDFL